jgi:hypothetical protein
MSLLPVAGRRVPKSSSSSPHSLGKEGVIYEVAVDKNLSPDFGYPLLYMFWLNGAKQVSTLLVEEGKDGTLSYKMQPDCVNWSNTQVKLYHPEKEGGLAKDTTLGKNPVVTFLCDDSGISSGGDKEGGEGKRVLFINIFGRAPQRGGGQGWITVGVGDTYTKLIRSPYFKCQFECELGNRITTWDFRESTVLHQQQQQQQQQQQHPPPIHETKIRRGGGLLDSLLGVGQWLVTTTTAIGGGGFGFGPPDWGPYLTNLRAVPCISSVLEKVDQQLIAYNGGVMPRAFFYLEMDHPGITDEWLFAQLATYATLRGGWRRNINTIIKEEEKYNQMIVTIILALTCYVGATFKYQPDAVLLKTGETLTFEHFNKLALFFKAGDCEELAWVNSIILTRLQRREVGQTGKNKLTKGENEFLDHCTKMMDLYVVTNVLCNATAPELSGSGSSCGRNNLLQLQMTPSSLEEDKNIAQLLPVWHMTCILIPKHHFLKACGIKEDQHNKYYRWPKETQKIQHFARGRLYAEGTTLVYPNPTDIFSDSLNLSQFMNIDRTKLQCCVLPTANNVKGDTCIYGVELQVMTDFFSHRGDDGGEMNKETIFIVETGEGQAGVGEFHTYDPTTKLVPQLTSSMVKFEEIKANGHDYRFYNPPLPGLDIDILKFREDLKKFEKDIGSRDFIQNPFSFYFIRQENHIEGVDIPWPSLQETYIRLAAPG